MAQHKSNAGDYCVVPSTTVVSSTSPLMRPPPPPLANNKQFHRTILYQQQRSLEIKQERSTPGLSHDQEPSSSIPDLEFDGTTVLCRVCGDKASGFHYGVHSCEGCKGFFRRSIQQKIQYRPCTKNQQCSILRINRNRCQYCRLKKCIAVGMSRDAVRFGRVPKREKARILAAMQQSSNSRSQEKTLIAELDDEQRLMATIIRAHIDTCDFTREKMEPLMHKARDQTVYAMRSGALICPLNPETLSDVDPHSFSKRFSPAIRNVVEFAKRIPGFHLLNQEDQVTLLKAGTFEVLLVRLCCLFDSETSSMLCVNGQLINRDMMHSSANVRFLMDSMFDFAESFNMFHLTEAEIALYCSLVIIAPDRPGLRNVELIERVQMKIKSTLQLMINQSHPGHHEILQELLKKIPDLRTLNTLHCERLLDCKLGDHEQYNTIQHIWMSSPSADGDDDNFKCEPWSSDGMTMVIDDAKSPQGSVSSTESLNSGEIAAVSMVDYHHHQQSHVSAHVSSAPLLAATLAGNICSLRHSQPSNGVGCSSSAGVDDEMPGTSSRLVQNDLIITPVVNRHVQQQSSNRTYVKVDSPTDSGIESDKTASSSGSSGGSSPPTSLCGSPRSSLEDHAAADEKHSGHSSSGSSIVDMPVLKRALQAPPLYDTTSLMDEAYKPHKKFRALRNAKDSAEADPIIVVSPPPMQLQQSLQYQPQKQQQSQLQMHLANSSQSSLSSTHSTLAKSLMEGPRMTAEQMKRTDIIHNYIMRGEAPSSPNNQHSISPLTSAATTTCPYKSPNSGNLLLCATSTMNHNYHYASSSSQQQQQQQQQHWTEQQRNSNSYVNNGTSVITTTTSRPIASSSYVLMQKNSTRVSPSPPQQIYFRTQSPPHSSTSPAPTVKQQPVSPPPSSPTAAGVVVVAPQSAASRIVELQLDIADSQQPLNLSKKSPSPMPRPLSAPTAMHKAVSLEA